MTPIEARIKYKFDTGNAPTYGEDLQTKCCNYRGALTHYYAEWLENKNGIKSCKKRGNYLKDTGHYAVYNKNGNLYYTKEYKEWLEEEYCKVNTLIHK